MPRIKALVFIAILFSLAAMRPSLAAPGGKSQPILNGIVRGPDGNPMEGVTVSAAAVSGTMTTSVFTDNQGHYYFPIAPAGKYRVWAQAVGYQAGRADVELNSKQATRQDFALSPDRFSYRNVWSAAELQAKKERWQLVCANVFGLKWSQQLRAMKRSECLSIPNSC